MISGMVLDHGLLVWGIGGQARGRGICVGFSSWPEAEEASPFYVVARVLRGERRLSELFPSKLSLR